MQVTYSHSMSNFPITSRNEMTANEEKEYAKRFEQILLQHEAVIARVVSSYEVIKALQEELFQEISVALWKALAKFDNQSSLKTYILAIAHKRAISHVAKYAKEPRTNELNEFEFQSGECPSEQLARKQRTHNLIVALRQLSMLERQLVTLALEGVSYKDIAEILGISTNLVGVKLNRAKVKLKDLMHGGKSS